MHLVCIYEGYCKTGEQIHGPKARVIVNRPGKEVTLVLTSYGPVTWEISPQDKTQIVKIILGGDAKQAVMGVPADTPITEGAHVIRFSNRFAEFSNASQRASEAQRSPAGRFSRRLSIVA